MAVRQIVQSRLSVRSDMFAMNALPVLAIERRPIAGRLLAVVDNVYVDPAAIRQFALDLSFERADGDYPGHFARTPCAKCPLVDVVARVALAQPDRVLVMHKRYRGMNVFAMPTVAGRDLTALQGQPHSDTFCDCAGILYLSRPEDCVGGTAFWRHRRTGLFGTPSRTEAVDADARRRLLGELMAEAAAQPNCGYLVESNNTWERIELVEMRQNRLVLYDANLFHSIHMPTSDWQADPERPRLTQNLYLTWAIAESV
jgi:Family of unknown function (DUF6445)